MEPIEKEARARHKSVLFKSISQWALGGGCRCLETGTKVDRWVGKKLLNKDAQQSMKINNRDLQARNKASPTFPIRELKTKQQAPKRTE